MKVVYFRIILVLTFLSFANSLLGQRTHFVVGLGGFAKHSFSSENPQWGSSQVPGYLTIPSKTCFLEPGYEFFVGIKFADRFDFLAGINSTTGHLHSSSFNEELNFHQINYPLRLRYHFGHKQSNSNFVMLGLSWGKILQRTSSIHRSTWQRDFLEDMNTRFPFNVEFGVGRYFFVTEKSNLIVNPFLSYELSKNEILKGFFSPVTLGIKFSHELNLR